MLDQNFAVVKKCDSAADVVVVCRTNGDVHFGKWRDPFQTLKVLYRNMER